MLREKLLVSHGEGTCREAPLPLVGFVLDQCDYHAIKIEEEHDQVKSKLGE